MWTTSDSSIASLASTGTANEVVITGAGVGTAIITGTITVNGAAYSDSIEVVVIPTITLDFADNPIIKEHTTTAIISSDPSGYTTGTTFRSQSNSIATVDQNGTITGVSSGSCKISAETPFQYTDSNNTLHTISINSEKWIEVKSQ